MVFVIPEMKLMPCKMNEFLFLNVICHHLLLIVKANNSKRFGIRILHKRNIFTPYFSFPHKNDFGSISDNIYDKSFQVELFTIPWNTMRGNVINESNLCSPQGNYVLSFHTLCTIIKIMSNTSC